MEIVKEYLKDVLVDAGNIDKNESRSCKYCTWHGTTLEEREGIDYCYHCHFYKKNKNFKLKKEIRLHVEKLTT